jgi:hypothetical protein
LSTNSSRKNVNLWRVRIFIKILYGSRLDSQRTNQNSSATNNITPAAITRSQYIQFIVIICPLKGTPSAILPHSRQASYHALGEFGELVDGVKQRFLPFVG